MLFFKLKYCFRKEKSVTFDLDLPFLTLRRVMHWKTLFLTSATMLSGVSPSG